jgi:hypothetical protein
MTRRAVLRGSRLSNPNNQVDRGDPPVPRHPVDFWCANDHRTTVTLALSAVTPISWPCARCGAPACRDRGAASPEPAVPVSPRTPYGFLMMRRTPQEGQRILQDALAALKSARSRACANAAAADHPTGRPRSLS